MTEAQCPCTRACCSLRCSTAATAVTAHRACPLLADRALAVPRARVTRSLPSRARPAAANVACRVLRLMPPRPSRKRHARTPVYCYSCYRPWPPLRMPGRVGHWPRPALPSRVRTRVLAPRVLAPADARLLLLCLLLLGSCCWYAAPSTACCSRAATAASSTRS